MPSIRPPTPSIPPEFPRQPPSSLLAIDVGNSRTKFGLLEFETPATSPLGCLPKLTATLAIRHGNPLPWYELGKWFGDHRSRSVSAVLAGVNPAGVDRVLAEWPGEMPAPLKIQDYHQLGLEVAVDFPEKVGIDRLLNGVAASHFRGDGRPVLIIDSGTAITVDRVSAAGVFEGGAILPGLELSGLALHRHTALLPQILPEELAPAGVAPEPLGKNTRDAIRSGLFWSQVGAVRELIRQLTPNGIRPVILVTGGAAPLLIPQLQNEGDIHAEEHLPLKGLALVGQRLLRSAQS